MTQLPPEEKQWQEFLRKHRPTPPPATVDLEERLMNAISTELCSASAARQRFASKKSRQPFLGRNLRAVPPALAAGLVMAFSGYRLLIPVPDSSNSANLEAFLQDNWNDVVGDKAVISQSSSTQTDSNSAQTDWTLLANTGQ